MRNVLEYKYSLTKRLTNQEVFELFLVKSDYLSATPPWPLKVFFDDDVNVGGFPSQTSSHGGQTSDPMKMKGIVLTMLRIISKQ